MKFKSILIIAATLLSTPAFAATITLTFEGASSFLSVDGFYNGGTDGGGLTGTNYGVSFGGDALAVSNDDLGPYFSNSPTPGTALSIVGPVAAMNVVSGFATTASFYYSSSEATTVNIYSGLNGTGTILGTFYLAANATSGCNDSPFCNWAFASVDFAGIAQSIQFGSAAGLAGFDNISVSTVPLPGAIWLMLSALGGFASFVRRRRAI